MTGRPLSRSGDAPMGDTDTPLDVGAGCLPDRAATDGQRAASGVGPAEPSPNERGLLARTVSMRLRTSPALSTRTATIIASTYDDPPDSIPVAWAKWQSELVAADLDKLAYFMGWRAVRELNVGDVVGPA